MPLLTRPSVSEAEVGDQVLEAQELRSHYPSLSDLAFGPSTWRRGEVRLRVGVLTLETQ